MNTTAAAVLPRQRAHSEEYDRVRIPLCTSKEATGYQTLLDLGLTEVNVAKRTGRSKATVARRVSLLALPEDVRERVHGHQVTIEQALILAEFADDPDTITRLEAELDDHGDLRWAAERERDSRARRAAAAALCDQLTAAGWTLATWTRDDTAPASVVRMAKPLAFHEVSCLPGYRNLDPEDRRDAHEDCPHRAAYIFPAGDDWLEVCLQPATHTPTTPAPGDAEDHGRADRADVEGLDGDDEPDDDQDEDGAAEAEAAERAAEQDRVDCAAAARVRRDHLRQYLTGTVTLTDTQRTAIIRHTALLAVSAEVPCGYPDDLALAEALGLDVDTITAGADADDEYAVERALREAIRTLKDPTRGLLAALTVGSEQPLRRPDQWTPTRISARDSFAGDVDPLCNRAWLDLVTGPLTYQPTPWETARLAAADQATAAPAEQ
jgi:hypothetical protein